MEVSTIMKIELFGVVGFERQPYFGRLECMALKLRCFEFSNW